MWNCTKFSSDCAIENIIFARLHRCVGVEFGIIFVTVKKFSPNNNERGKYMNTMTIDCCKVAVLVVLATLVATAGAEEQIMSPYANGGEVSIVETEAYKRYVHVFTNTAVVAQFRNKSNQTLRGRILVVGGGGAGGYGLNSASGGGGGGGGGGVLEREGVCLASGGCWNILVGKGSTATSNTSYPKNEVAGASSVSNATECIALVPGGGNGGESTSNSSISSGHAPTVGAAGGGGIRASASGAAGTYQSSILDVEYGPFSGAYADSKYTGGGGGAGAAGSGENGGEGLVSDITGISLVYGSGGGGGGSLNSSGTTISKGIGGTRAGYGASGAMSDSVADITAASAPTANSGGGGGGGLGGSYGGKGAARYGSSGADGIVVIAYEIYKIPFVGGEVTKIAEHGNTSTYIHVFTNANEVATFENRAGEDILVRALVVGAGGAGGYGRNSAPAGGGGGGGGGVRDTANITMPIDGVWNVIVGKGAMAASNTSSPATTAGSSSISNATQCIVLVDGGGNGGYGASSGYAAESGAAGGGGVRGEPSGASGTYASSILGDVYGPFSGGTIPDNYRGGGGGGAGAAGMGENGGDGLASDITGVSLVYGSGGGGGGSVTSTGVSYPNGVGGSRAGVGAHGDSVDNITAATAPVPNSGGGGAGGFGCNSTGMGAARYGSSGADGIVVIRYDWKYNPNPPSSGFMMIIK